MLHSLIISLSSNNSPLNTQRSRIVKGSSLMASGHSINSPFQPSGKDRRPHLDGDFRDLRLDPGTFRVTSLTYLTDANAHSGTTIVWPEGPQRIREFRKNNPRFSNHIHDMKAQFREMDLGDPIEVITKQGDVLFFHHLLPHNGTMNVSSTPRFAIRYMCLCLACRKWEKKEEWNVWMP